MPTMTAASALLSHWIAHLRDERRFATNSTEAYERDVSAFLEFLQGHLGGESDANALAELEPRDLRAYLAYRRQGPDALGDRSISRALAAIRSFYRYLERRHGVTNARLSLVRGPKLKRPLPRPVSEAAARDLISEAQTAAGEEWIGARDAALVTLLYAAGLRISEALALDGGDRPLPEMLRVVGKGGKERLVPLLAAARQAVERYAELCPFALTEDAPLFRAARGDLRAIQDLLGHESLSTTQAYTSVEAQKILQSYRRAHPRA
jgi:integrase/recombinase XerC